MKKAISSFALTILLTACKSTPPPPHIALEKENLKIVTSIKTIESSPEGKQKVDKARYLARHLMGTEQQQKLINNLKGEITEWDYTNTAISFVASSAITGKSLSRQGSSTALRVHAALDVIDFFFDGSKDGIGQMWLPKEVDGQQIKSAEHATKEAERLSIEAISKSLTSLGYSIPQYVGTITQGRIKVYTSKLTIPLETNQFPLQTQHLTVLQLVMDYEDVKAPSLLDELALGFTPAYRSSIAGHQIILMGGDQFDANGSLIMEKSETGQEFPSPKQELWMTSIGREFFRRVSNELLWIQGKDKMSNRTLV